jgi:glycosyltransferase 2 family protein
MSTSHVRPARTVRRRWPLVVVVVLVALLLQRDRLSELPMAIETLGRSEWRWVVGAAIASMVTYLMAAFAMVGTVGRHIPFRQALQVQVAGGAATLIAPAGLGSAGLNVWFLERLGEDRSEAVAAAVRNGVAGGLVHVVGLIVVVWQLPSLIALDPHQVRSLVVLSARIAIVTGALVAVLAVTQRHRLERLRSDVRQGWRTTVSLLRLPRRAAPLILGSVGLTLSYGVTLWASAHALGVPIDLPTAIALELVVEALGGLAATPGGVGVVEVAAVEGLLLLGADPAQALAVVLLHRLLTFWLPAVPGLVTLRRLPTTVPAEPCDFVAGRCLEELEPLTHRSSPRTVGTTPR